MALCLPDAWTWDMWFADDGEQFHAFYLKASRALGDPNRRHFNVMVGHAVSNDLTNWTEVRDALTLSQAGAFDDLTTWTGSVVRRTDGSWILYYTGTSRAEDGLVQRIGIAQSDDLYTWNKLSTSAHLEADRRWYEKIHDGDWFDEAWRDPWVFTRDGRWHMLITARANSGKADQRGVVGHATSDDGLNWVVQEPLSTPGSGFGQLEVTQVEEVEGHHVLIFCCMGSELSEARRSAGEKGGIYAVAADGPLGPFDITRATRITDESFYAGRLVQDRTGAWQLLAFRNVDPDGSFHGTMSDPMPVRWDDSGALRLAIDDC